MTLEDIIMRILVAGIIGALIGNERKKSGKPAGIATHCVVCLGAALLAMIQSKIDENILKAVAVNPKIIGAFKVDTARIPAQKYHIRNNYFSNYMDNCRIGNGSRIRIF